MVKICFYEKALGFRGTTTALYDYAYHNIKILGNESIILISDYENSDKKIIEKFEKQFQVFKFSSIFELEDILIYQNCDILYCIKYGTNDGIYSKKIKTIIHCVFELLEPHGDIYAGVSKTLAKKYNSDIYVPHMIGLQPSITKENLREKLNIPKNAIVFGRYGGIDTFNLLFCMETIVKIADERSDIYFLFCCTIKFPNKKYKNIIFLDDILYTDDEKNLFINSCDAYLECSDLGHSMGLAIGEFAVNNIPVICYEGKLWNTAHLDILKGKALYFSNENEFYNILTTFDTDYWKNKDNNHYKEYSPENIMKIFKKVFI